MEIKTKDKAVPLEVVKKYVLELRGRLSDLESGNTGAAITHDKINEILDSKAEGFESAEGGKY